MEKGNLGKDIRTETLRRLEAAVTTVKKVSASRVGPAVLAALLLGAAAVGVSAASGGPDATAPVRGVLSSGSDADENETELEGTVTSVDCAAGTLTIDGTTVQLTPDTEFEGLTCEEITPGMFLKVHVLDQGGILTAREVEPEDAEADDADEPDDIDEADDEDQDEANEDEDNSGPSENSGPGNAEDAEDSSGPGPNSGPGNAEDVDEDDGEDSSGPSENSGPGNADDIEDADDGDDEEDASAPTPDDEDDDEGEDDEEDEDDDHSGPGDGDDDEEEDDELEEDD